jgi:hypothetical protein
MYVWQLAGTGSAGTGSTCGSLQELVLVYVWQLAGTGSAAVLPAVLALAPMHSAC